VAQAQRTGPRSGEVRMSAQPSKGHRRPRPRSARRFSRTPARLRPPADQVEQGL
jgi:hypothetical protein